MTIPAPSNTPPEHIYIIRHGEKPTDPKSAPFGNTWQGVTNPDSLIPFGWQRSGALAKLFSKMRMNKRGLYVPTTLFSPLYGGAGSANHRTYQTIVGVSQELKLPINNLEPVGQESAMIARVLATATNTVLMCWEHDHIPDLAHSIPTVTGTVIPQSWPHDRFDVIWKFDLVPGSTPPVYQFSQIPQNLLAGDLPTVIPVTPQPHKKGRPEPQGLE